MQHNWCKLSIVFLCSFAIGIHQPTQSTAAGTSQGIPVSYRLQTKLSKLATWAKDHWKPMVLGAAGLTAIVVCCGLAARHFWDKKDTLDEPTINDKNIKNHGENGGTAPQQSLPRSRSVSSVEEFSNLRNSSSLPPEKVLDNLQKLNAMYVDPNLPEDKRMYVASFLVSDIKHNFMAYTDSHLPFQGQQHEQAIQALCSQVATHPVFADLKDSNSVAIRDLKNYLKIAPWLSKHRCLDLCENDNLETQLNKLEARAQLPVPAGLDEDAHKHYTSEFKAMLHNNSIYATESVNTEWLKLIGQSIKILPHEKQAREKSIEEMLALHAQIERLEKCVQNADQKIKNAVLKNKKMVADYIEQIRKRQESLDSIVEECRQALP